MLKFSLSVFRNAIDANSYRRGTAYFEQGSVKALHSEETQYGILLHALVGGSTPFPYEQEIALLVMNDRVIDIEGECS